MIAKKTITLPPSRGKGVLIPDGSPDMYGVNQQHLRQQAEQILGGSFEKEYGAVYISGCPHLDQTYPEGNAADYIASYCRRQTSTVTARPQAVWMCADWREPTTSPKPFYKIKGEDSRYGSELRTRVVAWLKGRQPGSGEYDASSQYANLVSELLDSSTVQTYLEEI